MNRTIPDESGRVHGWISEPSGRGTAGLLYTCLITIFLCVWSAMHIPIPARNYSRTRSFFYKVKLAVFAIIAPEYVFLNAIDEYFFIRDALDDIAITEEEISDRSKTDQLSKLITCLQILWFAIQLIGRAVQHLPTTNLELFTLGIVVCSFGTYAAYWRRPQDIRFPITISAKFSWGGEAGNSTKPFFSLGLSAVITGIFGACHLIGWDFLYPSSVEQLLWRIFSISCVVIPFLLIFFLWFDDDSDISFPECSVLLFASLVSLYVLARVYLLVAIFVSLRSVPAGVYQTVNWSLYFPHF
ncbi:hypothetical protein V8E54_006670 [Elaphomyces granulatus]